MKKFLDRGQFNFTQILGVKPQIMENYLHLVDLTRLPESPSNSTACLATIRVIRDLIEHPEGGIAPLFLPVPTWELSEKILLTVNKFEDLISNGKPSSPEAMDKYMVEVNKILHLIILLVLDEKYNREEKEF